VVWTETSVSILPQAVAERSLVDELNQKGGRYNVGQGAVVTMRPDGAIRAALDRREVDERLEGRTGLALGRGGAVELALRVVATTSARARS
jgi:penicillin-binding protein 1A